MSYTNGLDKPSDYFNTVLYTGNFSNNHSITGVGFKPDLVWTKNRTDGGEWHSWFDVIRGVTKRIYSNETNAEETASNSLISFDSDGFTFNADNNVNKSGKNFASWNWLASNTTASNTDGSITSSVSANTTSGFSIVSYSGNSTAGATIGHGLGVTPKMLIVRKRNSAENWLVYHEATGNTGATLLNTTTAFFADNMWNSTTPTSSVFTVHGDDGANGSGGNYIAYCFAEKKGYSKFGSYTGNGNADGTFVYTGMKTSFVIIKRTDTTSEWHMIDNKRNTFNTVDKVLSPNTSGAEVTTGSNPIDFLSNGFKTRGSGTQVNASGGTYIYMAFAENPFVTSTGIPTVAR